MRTDQETFSSIRSYFTWDHRRLDKALAEVVRLVDADIERAGRAFAHYERGIRRHMRVEEEVLLELYAHERTGAARSPSKTMLPEHAEISRLIEVIGRALAAHDKAAFATSHAELVSLVTSHERQEENDLYPYFDALMGPTEAEHIVTRLRAE